MGVMCKEKLFGPVLRHFRKEKGWSQEELAARLDVSRSHIGRLETGKKQPSLKMLFRLADALEIQAFEIIKAIEKAKEAQ